MTYPTEVFTPTKSVVQIVPKEEISTSSLPLSLATEAPLAVIERSRVPQPWGLRSMLSRWLSQETRTHLKKLAPWLVSGSILSLNLILHAPSFVVGALIAGLTVQVVRTIIRSSELSQRLWKWLLKKANLSEKQIPWLTAGFAGGAWLSAAMPSSAAFFVTAEQYLNRILTLNNTAGVASFIPLLFGTLRVIFIIYIGIALVRVINSFRNDEDWGTAARIPLIVVLCVVLGDALSGLIVAGAL